MTLPDSGEPPREIVHRPVPGGDIAQIDKQFGGPVIRDGVAAFDFAFDLTPSMFAPLGESVEASLAGLGFFSFPPFALGDRCGSYAGKWVMTA